LYEHLIFFLDRKRSLLLYKEFLAWSVSSLEFRNNLYKIAYFLVYFLLIFIRSFSILALGLPDHVTGELPGIPNLSVYNEGSWGPLIVGVYAARQAPILLPQAASASIYNFVFTPFLKGCLEYNMMNCTWSFSILGRTRCTDRIFLVYSTVFSRLNRFLANIKLLNYF
jgi:hypothetical protein